MYTLNIPYIYLKYIIVLAIGKRKILTKFEDAIFTLLGKIFSVFFI
jgi:hypothetical protein